MGTLGISYAEAITLILAAAIALVNTVAAPPRDKPATPTPIPVPEETSTPAPECPEGEFYNEPMGRCWMVETPAPEIGPTWGADIQATMDADPFDNDYQYIGWCADYADGGTRIVYHPCDAPPEATPPPE